MKFGDKLSILRKKEGLSQEELGDKLGVTRQTVSKWELGQSKPDTDKLMEISKLLHVDFNTLVDDNVELETATNNISNTATKNEGVSTDEVKPRIWLLVVLITIALIIVVILGTTFIGDRRAKEEEKNGIFDIFDVFSSSTGIWSSFDTEVFNSSFENDTGTKTGFFVTNTLDDIITNNKKNKDHLITVVFGDINTSDPEIIKNAKRNLNDNTKYEVSADYDKNGFINKITIETIETAEKEPVISDWDIRSFNTHYEMYAGTEWGSSVINVLDDIITNNKTKPDRIIRVIYENTNTTDENEIRNIKSKLDKWKTDYEVILDYDDVGFVNQVTIQN